jgi:GNAT superfamily N-acetyltransferase
MEHFLHINYRFTHDLNLENNEDANVDEIIGEIYYTDSESDSPIKIGKIELHLYDDYFSNYDYSLYDAFDRSIRTINLGDAIFDYETEELKSEIENEIGFSVNPNILVVHELMLYSKYRKKGYGKEIMENIEFLFGGKCGYIALQSFPKQHDLSLKESIEYSEYELENLNQNLEIAQSSLNSFYEKCGYKRIKGKHSYYIKNINPVEY